MRRTRLAFAGLFLFGQILWSAPPVKPSVTETQISTDTLTPQPTEEEYIVAPSTPTRRQLRQMRRHSPKRIPLRKFERKLKREIRKTKPNPKVAPPSASPMPPYSTPFPTMKPSAKRETRSQRFFGTVSKYMTRNIGGNLFVWLPAFSTDPNTGPTYGVMPVMVITNPATRHVRQLLAPSYTYNSLFGQTGTMRYYRYPTDSSQIVGIGSISQHTNRELKGRYENTAMLDGFVYFKTEGYYDVDGSNRFYGLGPGSHEGNETGYTSADLSYRALGGFNFANSWRATIGARLRRMDIRQNIIPNTPDIQTLFPTTPGLGRTDTVSGEFRLLWDSRDLPVTPSRGSSGELTIEKTSKDFGSDADYFRYGLEGKKFFLWNNPDYVTVGRVLYEKVNGPFVPFYELPSLGGRESLRGFGEGRFIDRGRLALNIEHRMTFSSIELMGIKTNFEFAPFFDLGSVFPNITQVERKNFLPVYGTALRCAVKPNVVGDVEIGVGKEGPAVFVDIDYPY